MKRRQFNKLKKSMVKGKGFAFAVPRLLLTVLFTFSFSLLAFPQGTVVPDSLLHQKWEIRPMIMPQTENRDSVFSGRGDVLYYDVDYTCRLISTHEYSEISEELNGFYYIIGIDPETFVKVYDEMVAASARYKNKAMEREMDYVWSMRYVHPDAPAEVWDKAFELAKKYGRKGDPETKFRMLNHMYLMSQFSTYWATGIEHRIPAVELINEILTSMDKLEKGSDLYKRYGQAVFFPEIGIFYYSHKQYDKALPLLWKAVEDPWDSYWNHHIMRARDYLGDYYAGIGDYERSDSLYLSILTSSCNVIRRPVYDVVAIGALAANANIRGNKQEAMRLYRVVLPRALELRDYALAGSYAAHLGRLYMERGEMEQTRQLMDSSRRYLVAGNERAGRNWDRYFALKRDYHLKMGNTGMVALYIDSLDQVKTEVEQMFNLQKLEQDCLTQQPLRMMEQMFNLQKLAYTEQLVFEQEKALQDKELEKQRSRIMLISVILVVITLLLAVFFYYNRKLHSKNRDLYRQIKAQDAEAARQEELWAEELQASTEGELSGNLRQRELVVRLRGYLLTDRNYAKKEIDVHTLTGELHTNRAYLFEAIKSITGKSLQEFINFLRLEEAKRLLETTDITIENIIDECGFSSARTFFRLFKTAYNISPAMHRKMAREEQNEKERE